MMMRDKNFVMGVWDCSASAANRNDTYLLYSYYYISPSCSSFNDNDDDDDDDDSTEWEEQSISKPSSSEIVGVQPKSFSF